MKITLAVFTIIVVQAAAFGQECGRYTPDRSGYAVTRREAQTLEFPWQISIQQLYIVNGTERRPLDHHQQRKFWDGLSPKEVAGVSKIHRQHLCNGAVITDRWAVTLGQCLPQKFVQYPWLRQRLFDGWVVVAGTRDLADSVGAQTPFEYRIEVAFRHMDFQELDYNPCANFQFYLNNLAVIKVVKPFSTKTVSPLCLSRPNDVFPPGTHCTVSGWTLDVKKNKVNPKLAYTDNITISEGKVCWEKYPALYDLPEDEFCAEDEGAELCKNADLGSPLSCVIDGRHYLVGTASWGDCGNPATEGYFDSYPAYFVNVSANREWIDTITKSF